MSLEQINFIFQIAASIAVVVSLIFVGIQIKRNTLELQRNEHNSTMEQWTVIRMAVAQNPDIARLVIALEDDRALEREEQLRLEYLMQEVTWAAFHIWDRTQRGVFPKGTFEFTGGSYLCGMLKTPRGSQWWNHAKHYGLHPDFVASVDAQLATDVAVPLLVMPHAEFDR